MNWLADVLIGTRAQQWPETGQWRLRLWPTAFIRHTSGFYERLMEKRSQRLAIKKLRSLSDRMLRDIGLHRGDIELYVRTGGDSRRLHKSEPWPVPPGSTASTAQIKTPQQDIASRQSDVPWAA